MFEAPAVQTPPVISDPSSGSGEAGHRKKQSRRNTHSYRTAWVSDVHLGTRGCQAGYLLHFLHTVELDTLYLVGDIVDGWSLKRSWYWHPDHSAVIRRLCELAGMGMRVIYIPGNHDELLRDYDSVDIAGVEVHREAIHQTADGRRFLVIHGDDFDAVCTQARWLAIAGDYAYRAAVAGNIAFNAVRRHLGYPYWSLAGYLKHQVKNAVNFISDFENALAREARRRSLDGVICGHIHCPQQRMIGDIEYCNDGDWVESCTALVEHSDGRLEILHWPDEIARISAAAKAGIRA